MVKALTSGKYLKLSLGALLLTWSSASFVVASNYNPPALNTQDLNNAPVHESAPLLDLNEINAKLHRQEGNQSAVANGNGATTPILHPNFSLNASPKRPEYANPDEITTEFTLEDLPEIKLEERKDAIFKLPDLAARKAQLNEKQQQNKSSSLFATFAISVTQDNDASLLKKQSSFLAALPPQDSVTDNPAVTLSKISASNDKLIFSPNVLDKPLSSVRMEYLAQAQQDYLSSQTMLAEVSSLASQIDKNFIQSSTVSSIQDSQDEIFELNASHEEQAIKEERLSSLLESEEPQSFYEEEDDDTSDDVIFIQGSSSPEQTEQTQHGHESLIAHSVPSLEISDLNTVLLDSQRSDEASQTHSAQLQAVAPDTSKSSSAPLPESYNSKQPNLDAHGELYNSDFMAEQFIALNLPTLEEGAYTAKDELTEEYEAYDEVLELQEQERIYKRKNRVLYEGTLPSAYTDEVRTESDKGHKFLSIPKEALEGEGTPRLYYDTNANNLSFSERADLDFYLNDANAPRPHYDENSHYGLDEIEVDPSVDLNDFKTFSDDNTLLYNSILDALDHSDELLLDSESKESSHAAPMRQKQRQIHSSHEKYLENLIYQDHRRYANDFAKSIPNDSKYDPKNFNWEVKMQSAQTESSLGKNYNTHNNLNNKESDVLYSSMHVDISNHHNDQTNDIDEEHINDYVIATNEDGESPWGNEVVTRTRITTYALRFKDNPFLPIEKLQKKQSSCINGKGYSCYLVGRHYDGLASLGRNNKNRMIAASELAKAHELYPHITFTSADFDHLLHTIVFFRRGCHLKHSLSCRLLLSTYGRYGGLIALGKTTVSDKQLGVRYLETGCKFEEPRSCANLAAMHINGYGTFEPNTMQGINYYVRSCRIARTVTNELRLIDPNLGIGCLELGRMYLYGAAFKDGGAVAKNYIKAHHYLHYACNLRSAAGCSMLKDNFTNHEYIKIPAPLNCSYDCLDLENAHKNTNKKIMVTPLNLGIGLGEDNLKIGKTNMIEDEEEEEEDFFF